MTGSSFLEKACGDFGSLILPTWTASPRCDFVECGVNAGFVSSAIMQRLDWAKIGKRFYLIDTFSGPILSQYSREEIDRGRSRAAEEALAKGAYVTDLDRVRANYAEWPNAEIVQGAVPGVLPSLASAGWRSLAPGCVAVFDDYAYFRNDALAEAIDGAAASLDAEVLSLPTGQGLIVK